MAAPAQRRLSGARPVFLSGSHGCGRRLDEFCCGIWVGDHRHVPGGNFDGGRSHDTLGITAQDAGHSGQLPARSDGGLCPGLNTLAVRQQGVMRWPALSYRGL